ncbi:hypothetical protein [Pelagicoccus sp. SDUM812005]|uniref:VOC family protein n=1 Tax=Pelagicoccus sp. SDUM812005 TaxID=3041257 RepID=UPI00280D09D6|nr:hypothetical protein [Pelagicoccus sp. SDUM812005]MDQ8182577.1 hypothetical protein [Pelagicoccus sp. SDUM812005]
MKLGAFSVSLSVKDIHASKAFYQKLGFEAFAGDIEQKWLVMKNDDHLIGLFEGMFEENLLTFNPGWDQEGKNKDPFDDIRTIQKRLKTQGIQVEKEIDPASAGPASLSLTDPDGNRILIDQHR